MDKIVLVTPSTTAFENVVCKLAAILLSHQCIY